MAIKMHSMTGNQLQYDFRNGPSHVLAITTSAIVASALTAPAHHPQTNWTIELDNRVNNENNASQEYSNFVDHLDDIIDQLGDIIEDEAMPDVDADDEQDARQGGSLTLNQLPLGLFCSGATSIVGNNTTGFRLEHFSTDVMVRVFTCSMAHSGPFPTVGFSSVKGGAVGEELHTEAVTAVQALSQRNKEC